VCAVVCCAGLCRGVSWRGVMLIAPHSCVVSCDDVSSPSPLCLACGIATVAARHCRRRSRSSGRRRDRSLRCPTPIASGLCLRRRYRG
jgi:hypothetical protein